MVSLHPGCSTRAPRTGGNKERCARDPWNLGVSWLVGLSAGSGEVGVVWRDCDVFCISFGCSVCLSASIWEVFSLPLFFILLIDNGVRRGLEGFAL